MQTALSWLLDQLEQAGRRDLINGYYERNRAYNLHKVRQEKEEKLEQWRELLPTCETDKYRSYVQKKIEKIEKYLRCKKQNNERDKDG
jgi:RNA binding exosome subunit